MPVDVEKLRQLLEKELEEATRELEELEKRLEVKGDYGLGIGDPHIIQWELNLALRDRAAQKVKDIKRALDKLAKGSYGVCEVCGKPIEEGRLELLPYTTLCSKCASQHRR